MTEPQTITADHLRELLDGPPDRVLGLVEGEVRVVGDSGAPGALEVVTATDLRAQVGDAADAEELRAAAAALTVAAQHLGG